MIRRPPRSTLSSSSAASDVYKRQITGTYPSAISTHPTDDPLFLNLGGFVQALHEGSFHQDTHIFEDDTCSAYMRYPLSNALRFSGNHGCLLYTSPSPRDS
eukprot:TRINITY_DN42605_c0_g1_i1.p1 TRINITY_DN42605_c0_g1~~TRINITY_DN42605_c0_g1_i1.p1  ORF type:complete len:101 (+),score=11.89 TRINITY_DN42605_c0_g1_i1:64-366(+)